MQHTNPEFYLFDDSFSALDFKTDAVLRKKLHEYAKDATQIIVGQRIGSIMHADQILVIDHFGKRTDSIALSCVQFAAVFVLCGAGALLFESPQLSQLRLSLPHILYVGIFSSALAYTLQIVAQKDGNPVIVSLLLSLESFFAVLVSAVWLHERLSLREVAGCVLMMTAVVLCQLKPENAET